EKILAVPAHRITKMYDEVDDYLDLPRTILDRIAHFFEHYKDLEPDKWVKIIGWEGMAEAHRLIREGIAKG
ncbi:MAG: inorganic diphosphatase, partial [Gammaproteobacteria bacterium]|nr:inorganic diphosphatase [Gammaproteobacteria bacterium]